MKFAMKDTLELDIAEAPSSPKERDNPEGLSFVMDEPILNVMSSLSYQSSFESRNDDVFAVSRDNEDDCRESALPSVSTPVTSKQTESVLDALRSMRVMLEEKPELAKQIGNRSQDEASRSRAPTASLSSGRKSSSKRQKQRSIPSRRRSDNKSSGFFFRDSSKKMKKTVRPPHLPPRPPTTPKQKAEKTPQPTAPAEVPITIQSSITAEEPITASASTMSNSKEQNEPNSADSVTSTFVEIVRDAEGPGVEGTEVQRSDVKPERFSSALGALREMRQMIDTRPQLAQAVTRHITPTNKPEQPFFGEETNKKQGDEVSETVEIKNEQLVFEKEESINAVESPEKVSAPESSEKVPASSISNIKRNKEEKAEESFQQKKVSPIKQAKEEHPPRQEKVSPAKETKAENPSHQKKDQLIEEAKTENPSCQVKVPLIDHTKLENPAYHEKVPPIKETNAENSSRQEQDQPSEELKVDGASHQRKVLPSDELKADDSSHKKELSASEEVNDDLSHQKNVPTNDVVKADDSHQEKLPAKEEMKADDSSHGGEIELVLESDTPSQEAAPSVNTFRKTTDDTGSSQILQVKRLQAEDYMKTQNKSAQIESKKQPFVSPGDVELPISSKNDVQNAIKCKKSSQSTPKPASQPAELSKHAPLSKRSSGSSKVSEKGETQQNQPRGLSRFFRKTLKTEGRAPQQLSPLGSLKATQERSDGKGPRQSLQHETSLEDGIDRQAQNVGQTSKTEGKARGQPSPLRSLKAALTGSESKGLKQSSPRRSPEEVIDGRAQNFRKIPEKEARAREQPSPLRSTKAALTGSTSTGPKRPPLPRKKSPKEAIDGRAKNFQKIPETEGRVGGQPSPLRSLKAVLAGSASTGRNLSSPRKISLDEASDRSAREDRESQEKQVFTEKFEFCERQKMLDLNVIAESSCPEFELVLNPGSQSLSLQEKRGRKDSSTLDTKSKVLEEAAKQNETAILDPSSVAKVKTPPQTNEVVVFVQNPEMSTGKLSELAGTVLDSESKKIKTKNAQETRAVAPTSPLRKNKVANVRAFFKTAKAKVAYFRASQKSEGTHAESRRQTDSKAKRKDAKVENKESRSEAKTATVYAASLSELQEDEKELPTEERTTSPIQRTEPGVVNIDNKETLRTIDAQQRRVQALTRHMQEAQEIESRSFSSQFKQETTPSIVAKPICTRAIEGQKPHRAVTFHERDVKEIDMQGQGQAEPVTMNDKKLDGVSTKSLGDVTGKNSVQAKALASSEVSKAVEPALLKALKNERPLDCPVDDKDDDAFSFSETVSLKQNEHTQEEKDEYLTTGRDFVVSEMKMLEEKMSTSLRKEELPTSPNERHPTQIYPIEKPPKRSRKKKRRSLDVAKPPVSLGTFSSALTKEIERENGVGVLTRSRSVPSACKNGLVEDPLSRGTTTPDTSVPTNLHEVLSHSYDSWDPSRRAGLMMWKPDPPASKEISTPEQQENEDVVGSFSVFEDEPFNHAKAKDSSSRVHTEESDTYDDIQIFEKSRGQEKKSEAPTDEVRERGKADKAKSRTVLDQANCSKVSNAALGVLVEEEPREAEDCQALIDSSSGDKKDGASSSGPPKEDQDNENNKKEARGSHNPGHDGTDTRTEDKGTRENGTLANITMQRGAEVLEPGSRSPNKKSRRRRGKLEKGKNSSEPPERPPRIPSREGQRNSSRGRKKKSAEKSSHKPGEKTISFYDYSTRIDRRSPSPGARNLAGKAGRMSKKRKSRSLRGDKTQRAQSCKRGMVESKGDDQSRRSKSCSRAALRDAPCSRSVHSRGSKKSTEDSKGSRAPSAHSRESKTPSLAGKAGTSKERKRKSKRAEDLINDWTALQTDVMRYDDFIHDEYDEKELNDVMNDVMCRWLW